MKSKVQVDLKLLPHRELLSYAELEVVAGIPEDTLRQYRKDKLITPAIARGKKVRFNRKKVIEQLSRLH